MTSDPLLSQALDGFYMARRADGYSPDTIDQYKWALTRLLTFTGDKPISAISLDDARRFLVHVNDGSLSGTSIFHVWKALRAFYKWLSPEFEIPNVMRGLKQPPFATPEIKPLSNENIEKLVKAAGLVESRGQYKPKHADRNRLVILFLLDTGLRVGELCRLNVDDVNLETGEVQVIPYRSGLKSRPRTVYIGRRVQKELWRYLLGREPMRENPLFLSNDEKRLTPDSIKHLMNRIGERAQIHLHPHALRHLFAITYLRNGGDVFTLQRLLGHSSLSMVQHYLALAKTDLQSAHRRSSPVDNMRL